MVDSCDSVGRISELRLRRARLVLGWDWWPLVVCYLGIYPGTQAHSAWPSSMGRNNEYWLWSRLPLGDKRRVLRSLIGFKPRRFKGKMGWAPSWWTSQSMCKLPSSLCISLSIYAYEIIKISKRDFLKTLSGAVDSQQNNRAHLY